MFIELTAAFKNGEQPDFEGMGIKPSEDDWNNVNWMPLYVHYDYISNMNINDTGNTNITLITGEVWTVKESMESIKEQCLSAKNAN